MGAIDVCVSDYVESRLRETATKLYGHGKGSLNIAAKEAFSQWVCSMAGVVALVDTIEDPVEAISGLLSGIDADGVELQHAAREIRSIG
jgi:hypothetical protein